MRKLPRVQVGPEAGFTLIELMVVIVIATILIAIAAPSYMTQTRKAHRTDAKTALLDLAGREERLMSTKGVYSGVATDLGYSGTFPQAIGSPGSQYYLVNITNINQATAPTATAPGTPATFLITATAINTQVKDTQCLTFSVDNTGAQTATNTGCW